MANSLNKNLRIGDVVVAKRKAVKPNVQDLRMVVRVESFGASASTMGTKIGVSWMVDGEESMWDGMQLDKNLSEVAQEAIYTDPTYGWLFNIIKEMQSTRKYQEHRINQLQEMVHNLTELAKKNKRTRVVSIRASAILGDDDTYTVYVLRTDGSERTYHISQNLNNWLYSTLLFAGGVDSTMWNTVKRNRKPGDVVLYP